MREAERGHVECVTILLSRGANATLTNADGQTPAELASLDAVKGVLLRMSALGPQGEEGENFFLSALHDADTCHMLTV